MATSTIADIDVAGKAVVMRVDFNVPVQDGWISDDRRIVQALPTIRHALDHGARLVLMSHGGRPAGKGYEADFSLCLVANRLGALLGKPVVLGPPNVVGPELDRMVAGMQSGGVVLLENLRFHPGETMPDLADKRPDEQLTEEESRVHDDFVAALARLGEVYVNDAFGTCHRRHASMYGLARAIRAKGGPVVAGFLVEKEIRYLREALVAPRHPFLVILGGGKVGDKIKLVGNLLDKVDRILVGGAMAYTLLSAKGVSVGRSAVDVNHLPFMKELLHAAADKIVLPCDHVASDHFTPKPLQAGPPSKVDGEAIPAGLIGLDIGEKTREAYRREILAAGTVLWNGPMGVFELPDYAAGTEAIARAIAAATRSGAATIVGGGDSAVAIERLELSAKIAHVSTGGGASLTYLESSPMPAIEVLDQK